LIDFQNDIGTLNIKKIHRAGIYPRYISVQDANVTWIFAGTVSTTTFLFLFSVNRQGVKHAEPENNPIKGPI